jgi:ATP-dependent RNA helicase SUPV3L1/SUV3
MPPVEAPVRAVLGPTNTGKTHRAIERMLEHDSAMIGLPLRLLAREVYDRLTARVGEGAVALVTGEEKRVPPRPRHWVCTVEAMPVDLPVDFLAVDEIQLATHRQRGHVFTDRLLRARGARETWFLGSHTMRPLLSRLCPTAELDGRPRFSRLTSAGSVPLSGLPPRSAVVAFSATRVYELAERLRGKRGGAAVVIGALSPRARNAQVALFQSGEVDTLVATDAIGMGLNLDLDQVVFADLRKFDGREARALEDAELAQIAGRAGRHQRDGRFATLEPLPPLSPATARALEQHRFAPDQQVYWRNPELDLDSLDGLLVSLRRRPPAPWLRLASEGEDLRAATALARHAEVQALARGPERVALFWEVCQIPDFRQLPFDDHFNLLGAIYQRLCHQGLPRDWIDAHVQRLDHTEGDLETLLDRMSAVRTWTYVTSHRDWVDEAAAWQARTHALEDRLSDALHRKLVERFVERPGTRPPVRRRAGDRSLAGQLAALVPVAGAAPDQLELLVEAPHTRFTALADGRIAAGELILGRLVRGPDRLHPEVSITVPVAAGLRLRLARRLLAFARDLAAELLAPLRPEAPLAPAARGVLYQVEQTLGSVLSSSTRQQSAELSPADRRALRRAGVVLGRVVTFAPALLTPAALQSRRALCAAELWPERPPPALDEGRLEVQPGIPTRIYESLGYPLFAGLALRADLLDAAARTPLPAIAERCALDDEDAAQLCDQLRRLPRAR